MSSSCSGVKPFREAWVATGMKRGSWTGPCGRFKVAARALVVYEYELACIATSLGDQRAEMELEGLTEQRAMSLNVRAEGMGGMVYSGALS